jgi:hypothetical protein
LTSTTPFRLFILGDLPPAGGDVELISLAEYRHARVLSRTTLRAADLDWFRQAIRDLRGFIEIGSPVLEPGFLKDLGARLFELVIRSTIRDLFVTATAQRDGFVPFELFVESSALASWPWEYLFDSGTRMFVCRDFHPISRSIFDQTLPLTTGETRKRLRLLVVLGAADDDDEIDVDEEVLLLESVFRSYLEPDRFEMVVKTLSASELTMLLQTSRGRFDIVHFLGHSAFDLSRSEGYLRLMKAGARESTKLYANDFAQAAADSRIRLAFLNACETARSAIAEEPARSSVAAALLGRGIPAVVAHQFSVPDNGAHFFAIAFYNLLSCGRPLIEAMRAGRAAMSHADDNRPFDWGIPVLYTRDPQVVVFPATDRQAAVETSSGGASQSFMVNPASNRTTSKRQGREDRQRQRGAEAATARSWSGDSAFGSTRTERSGDVAPDQPVTSTPVPSSEAPPAPGRPLAVSRASTVAIVDIDARAGFLAATIEAANRAQSYYQFRLAYLPVPRGAVRKQVEDSAAPQLFIPALEDFAATTPQELKSDWVCFITRNLLAGHGFWNHLAATLDTNPAVFFVTTADLRDFARLAGTTFAKATLLVCLSMLVASDERWDLDYHSETAGCLLDYCWNRSDMIVGLKKMRFDHAPCRSKIMDKEMLAAIDAIIALQT